MIGAFLPTCHRGTRRIFITQVYGNVFAGRAVGNFLLNFSNPLLESIMADPTVPAHIDTVLSRFRADEGANDEWRKPLLFPKLIHQLIYAFNYFFLIACCRRRRIKRARSWRSLSGGN